MLALNYIVRATPLCGQPRNDGMQMDLDLARGIPCSLSQSIFGGGDEAKPRAGDVEIKAAQFCTLLAQLTDREAFDTQVRPDDGWTETKHVSWN